MYCLCMLWVFQCWVRGCDRVTCGRQGPGCSLSDLSWESLPVSGPDDSGGPLWLSHSRQGTAFTFEVFPPPHRHQFSLWILHLALPCPDWMGSAKGRVIQGVYCWKPGALKRGALVGLGKVGGWWHRTWSIKPFLLANLLRKIKYSLFALFC